MNALTKSCAALALLTGMAFATVPALAKTAIVLPAPAPAQAALNSLLDQPAGPLPAGTRLLSIRVADGLATVNFSQELKDNFAGGDTAETRAVNAVLRTLGRFPTISRAQILVESRTVDSLGGLLTLSDPLPVIRPAADAAAFQAHQRWLHRKMHSVAHP